MLQEVSYDYLMLVENKDFTPFSLDSWKNMFANVSRFDSIRKVTRIDSRKVTRNFLQLCDVS